jgi:hypothetical protein
LVTAKDIIHLPLSETEIKACIKKAIENLSISSRDNLRNRHPNIQFDCMLRGYIGEFAFHKWLNQYELKVEATNLRLVGDSIDIDFLYKGRSLELKTSLIPDADKNIATAIAKRDIKLIKRENSIDNFRGDIHLQVFYAQKRKAKDTWLKTADINLNTNDVDYLYKALLAKAYINSTYFVGWIDKNTLVDSIKKLNENQREWTFKGSLRKFWNCKISNSNKPEELIAFLKAI